MPWPSDDNHERGRAQQLCHPCPVLALAHCLRCFITPQNILLKLDKIDHQIFDTSCKYDWDSVPTNSMTSMPFVSELHCEFGYIWEAILTHVYMHITYPHNNIAVHANDVKSCFNKIKHYPDIIGAFLYILAEYLFFQSSKPLVPTSAPLTGKLCAKHKPSLQNGCFMTSPCQESITTS